MFTDDVRRAVDQSVLCWLATVDGEGQPNVSPKEMFYAVGDREIHIAEIASPVSRRNIQGNHKVCVSFVDVFRQKGYKIHGDARMVCEDAGDFEALAAPLQKMAGPEFKVRGVVVVEAIRATPIVAPSYRLYPDRTEAEQIRNAFRTYGVRAVE